MANKVGRPPRKPQSAHELREAALCSIQSSQERIRGEHLIPVAQLKDKVESLNFKKRYTRKEIEELRKQVTAVYEEFIATQDEAQAQENVLLNESLRSIHIDAGITGGKPITEAEWNMLHDRRADGTKKRGPKPNKKKQVWDLSPGECGTAEEPLPPVDLDAMEKAYEEAMMEQAIEAQKAQPKYAVGKRLRSNAATPRPSVDQSKFYY